MPEIPETSLEKLTSVREELLPELVDQALDGLPWTVSMPARTLLAWLEPKLDAWLEQATAADLDRLLEDAIAVCARARSDGLGHNLVIDRAGVTHRWFHGGTATELVDPLSEWPERHEEATRPVGGDPTRGTIERGFA